MLIDSDRLQERGTAVAPNASSSSLSPLFRSAAGGYGVLQRAAIWMSDLELWWNYHNLDGSVPARAGYDGAFATITASLKL